jgi:aldose sugar dehydrogenase
MNILAVRARALLAIAVLSAAATPAAAQTPRLQPVASGLEHPWAVAFLPAGRFLVTERPGRMRVVEPDGRLGPPLQGVPEVVARRQGGLLDVVLDSDFERNRTLYFCYSEPGEGGNGTAMARARLSDDRSRLEGHQVIFRQKPKVDSQMHFGCRIVEARDGTLFLALGDRFNRMQEAQKLDNHIGKVVRVNKDGSVPRDNPFVGRAGALPEIWSYGHRNAQGATLAPDGTYWMHEHGPQGGDEINLPKPGRNYGWPVITYGENYGGGKVGEGITRKEGMEQPLHQWTPSIAPSGMTFLTSDRYGPAMKGDLFVGSLKFAYLARLELEGGKVAREHRIEAGGRVRDVAQGPDGLLYLLTDETNGKLLRLQP